MKRHHLTHAEEVKGGHDSHMHHKKMHDHHMSEAKKHMSHMHKMAKQGKNARLDESLGERRGKESSKKQSMASRRHESRGAKK